MVFNEGGLLPMNPAGHVGDTRVTRAPAEAFIR
jgi:hypothetical protein